MSILDHMKHNKKLWIHGTATGVLTASTVGLGVGMGVAIHLAYKAKDALGNFMIVDGVDSKNIHSKEKGKINLLALGDSITAGYNGALGGADYLSYADFLRKDLENAGFDVTYTNSAHSGATTDTLYDLMKNQGTLNRVKDADLITLSIGGNDILRAMHLVGLPFASSLINGGDTEYGYIDMLKGDTSTSGMRSEETLQGPTVTTDYSKIISTVFKHLEQTAEGDLTGLLGPQLIDMGEDNLFDKLKLIAARQMLTLLRDLNEVNPHARLVYVQAPFPLYNWPDEFKNTKNIPYRKDGKVTMMSLIEIWDGIQKNFKDAIEMGGKGFASYINMGDTPTFKSHRFKNMPYALDIHPSLYGHSDFSKDLFKHLSPWLDQQRKKGQNAMSGTTLAEAEDATEFLTKTNVKAYVDSITVAADAELSDLKDGYPTTTAKVAALLKAVTDLDDKVKYALRQSSAGSALWAAPVKDGVVTKELATPSEIDAAVAVELADTAIVKKRSRSQVETDLNAANGIVKVVHGSPLMGSLLKTNTAKSDIGFRALYGCEGTHTEYDCWLNGHNRYATPLTRWGTKDKVIRNVFEGLHVGSHLIGGWEGTGAGSANGLPPTHTVSDGTPLSGSSLGDGTARDNILNPIDRIGYLVKNALQVFDLSSFDLSEFGGGSNSADNSVDTTGTDPTLKAGSQLDKFLDLLRGLFADGDKASDTWVWFAKHIMYLEYGFNKWDFSKKEYTVKGTIGTQTTAGEAAVRASGTVFSKALGLIVDELGFGTYKNLMGVLLMTLNFTKKNSHLLAFNDLAEKVANEIGINNDVNFKKQLEDALDVFVNPA